jgi:hypothetical protein
MTNNPELYKVATQQLAALAKLVQMSIAIGDTEGARIIQATETMVERRIQVTSMNLSALEYLERLISQGHDYADAEWRTSQCYPIDQAKLRATYDDQFQPS